jgi:hypothetical protein
MKGNDRADSSRDEAGNASMDEALVRIITEALWSKGPRSVHIATEIMPRLFEPTATKSGLRRFRWSCTE